jgi:glutathione S-transferase
MPYRSQSYCDQHMEAEMKLIGRYDSPYVRRVGVSLHLLGLAFEHLPLSPFSQAADLRKYSPLGRMPVLALSEGEVIIDSFAILDYLDEIAGPERKLLPSHGVTRRKVLQLVVNATGAADKAIAMNYERRRPLQQQSAEWLARCRGQLDAALVELETKRDPDWSSTVSLTQAEITIATMFGYIRRVEPTAVKSGTYPRLERVAFECERRSEFLACPP